MGIIAKQGYWNFIVLYIGVIVGTVNNLILMPRALSPHELGVFSVLLSLMLIGGQISLFGGPQTVIKFYPKFMHNQANGLVNYVLKNVIISLIIAIAIFFLFKDYIVNAYSGQSSIFGEYYLIYIPLLTFFVFQEFFGGYLRSLLKTVHQSVIKDLISRVFQSGLFMLLLCKVIHFDQFLIFYVCGYLLNTLLYLKIIRKTVSYKINVPFEVPKKEKKSIIKFSAAIFSTGVAGTLLSNIDIIMIGAIAPIVMGFDGIELAGIYGRMAFMAILILIPMRSVMNIATPVISAAWQQGDQKELGSIYSKSSLTMSVIGVFTFLGIWINIDSVFLIFPEGFEVGKYAFLFLAIGNLIQAAMGANGAIIWNSSYYWLSSITVPLLALSIVIGNLIFIPKYGLIGAAVATAASRLIFAIITFLFLLIKYKMQPFSWRHLYTFGIAFGVILIVSYIPLFEHLILDIAIRSIVASILFIPAILLPKISPDINGTAHKLLNRLNSKK